MKSQRYYNLLKSMYAPLCAFYYRAARQLHHEDRYHEDGRGRGIMCCYLREGNQIGEMGGYFWRDYADGRKPLCMSKESVHLANLFLILLFSLRLFGKRYYR